MLTIEKIKELKDFKEFSIALCEELQEAYNVIEMTKNRIETIARLVQKYQNQFYPFKKNDIGEILGQLVILRNDICDDKESIKLAEDCHDYV